MTAKVPMQAAGNLRFPKDKALRPRQPIPEMDGYSISQNGYVAGPDGELVEASRWPWHDILVEDAAIMIHVVNATAAAWLDEALMSRIRAEVPASASHTDPKVQALEAELQVSRHAIAAVARHPDGLPALFEVEPEPEGESGKIELQEVEAYSTFLLEPSRPPSKGGNTRALHSHRITIAGTHYYFKALGTRRWVFSGDRVTFSFTISASGYNQVSRASLRCFSKTGAAVVRGDRGYKTQLRTAATRMPGSRREFRD